MQDKHYIPGKPDWRDQLAKHNPEVLQEYDLICRAITDRFVYVDRIEIKLVRIDVGILERIFGPGLLSYRNRKACLIPRKTKPKWPNDIYQGILQIRQPSADELDFIGIYDPRHAVFSLETTLDLITPIPGQSTDFLNRHRVQLYHGHRHSRSVDGNLYSAQRDDTRNCLGYARPSKITGEPCAHLDFRLRGLPKLKDYGLESCGKIIQADLMEVVRKELVLEALKDPDPNKLIQHMEHRVAVLADRTTRRSSFMDREYRIVMVRGILKHWHGSELDWPDLPMQALVEADRDVQRIRLSTGPVLGLELDESIGRNLPLDSRRLGNQSPINRAGVD